MLTIIFQRILSPCLHLQCSIIFPLIHHCHHCHHHHHHCLHLHIMMITWQPTHIFMAQNFWCHKLPGGQDIQQSQGAELPQNLSGMRMLERTGKMTVSERAKCSQSWDSKEQLQKGGGDRMYYFSKYVLLSLAKYYLPCLSAQLCNFHWLMK